MAKIWLTYAWTDNDDQDVDHVIRELEHTGLTVSYDRADLRVGRSIWGQIDKAMHDPSVDGWVMFVTKNSLQSEACQEEIAYALDRALRAGRENFPLIGLFPQPIDRSLIPSAIATRLYVYLNSPDWKEQIYNGVSSDKKKINFEAPLEFGFQLHPFGEKKILEVWPKSGRWAPFSAVIPKNSLATTFQILSGPRGLIPMGGWISGCGPYEQGELRVITINNPIDCNNSAYIVFDILPKFCGFGGGSLLKYKVDF